MSTPVLRRALSGAVALAVAVVLPTSLTGRAPASAEPSPVKTGMQHHRLHGLPATAAAAARAATGAVSDEVSLDGRAHVVGVTWPHAALADGARVEIRERGAGGWGAWTELDVDGADGPDPGTPEAEGARGGTSPWITTADAVQVRVLDGGPGSGTAARLDVVDATVAPADTAVGAAPAGAASGRASRPTILTRAQWGADESMRHAILDYGTVKAAVVHHTAGSNTYSAADVPSIIRGIYVFHTDGRGWGDIGYNFLIDKFGRIWEGRYGGIDKPVVGAQAGGFNSQTFGASTLGDFTSVAPPAAVVTAQSKLAAWKLGLSYVDPTATTSIDGAGTRNTVMGHRDLNPTGCPGTEYYALLPSIRSKARAYQGTMFYRPSVSATTRAYGAGGFAVQADAGAALSWRLTVRSPCRSDALAVVRGAASSGQRFTAEWDGLLADGSAAPPGDYRVTLSASTGSGTRAAARPVSYTVTVTSTAGAPPGFCPPRLSAGDRYSFAVASARRVSATTRVVLVNGTRNGMPLAFVAGPLARAKGAVLLQTHSDYLPDATRAEIVRRGVTDVTIVGGPAWVSEEVVADLAAIGIDADRVERIVGSSRYEVAGNVARAITDGGPAPDVILASGPETSTPWLAVAGPAAALRRPILLTRKDLLPRATATVLADLDVQRVVVAGGPRIVPDDVVAQLPDPTRLKASNRYTLSVVVADWARDAGVDVSRVFVGSGAENAYPNTISAGQKGWVELFVARTEVPGDVAAWLDGNAALTRVDVLGGTGSVSMLTGGRVQEAVLD